MSAEDPYPVRQIKRHDLLNAPDTITRVAQLVFEAAPEFYGLIPVERKDMV